jgi:hypothetical protein
MSSKQIQLKANSAQSSKLKVQRKNQKNKSRVLGGGNAQADGGFGISDSGS